MRLPGFRSDGYDEERFTIVVWGAVSVWVLIVVEWIIFIGGVVVAEMLLQRKLRS